MKLLSIVLALFACLIWIALICSLWLLSYRLSGIVTNAGLAGMIAGVPTPFIFMAIKDALYYKWDIND